MMFLWLAIIVIGTATFTYILSLRFFARNITNAAQKHLSPAEFMLWSFLMLQVHGKAVRKE